MENEEDLEDHDENLNYISRRDQEYIIQGLGPNEHPEQRSGGPSVLSPHLNDMAQ
jgi:hypothetical protein